MEEQVIEQHHQGNIASILEKSQNYAKLSFEITKLKGLNTTAAVVTTLITRLTIMFVITLFCLLVSIGVAFWLGDILGKNYYGFFIVGGFYLVVGFVLSFFLQDWLRKPISNLIISQALE